MQIHELNTYNGDLDNSAYAVIDNGMDTGKLSIPALLKSVNDRLDNIIAAPAPSAQEVTDARLGGNGITYNSLGDAIRGQYLDLDGDIDYILGDIFADTDDIISSINTDKFGSGLNGATYSSDVLSIPSGSTGRSSYIGIRLNKTAAFDNIVNKIVHIQIKYAISDSSITYEPYIFTNNAYMSNVKLLRGSVDSSNNIVDLYIAFNTTAMTYIFTGIKLSMDTPAVSANATISVGTAEMYMTNLSDMYSKVGYNSSEIDNILSVLPTEKTGDATPQSVNPGYFMAATGKVLSIGNQDYKIAVYSVTRGNSYKFYSEAYSLADSAYAAVAFSKSATIQAQAVPDEIVFRAADHDEPVNVSYFCKETGYLWVAEAPNRGQLTIANAQIVPVADSSRGALNYKKYKKFLTIGDSLTNATGGGNTNTRWQNVVTEILGLEGHTRSGAIGLCVADVGGGSIYQAVQNLTTDPDVDLVSFWGGTNDWSNDVPLGNFDTEIAKVTSDETTFYGACIECMKKLSALYPAKRIFCVGTTPRYINVAAGEHSNNTPNNIGLYLYDYVDALKKVSEYFGFPFLDLYRESGINHLNIAQYMFMQTLNGNNYYLHFSVNGEYEIGYRMVGFITKIG